MFPCISYALPSLKIDLAAPLATTSTSEKGGAPSTTGESTASASTGDAVVPTRQVAHVRTEEIIVSRRESGTEIFANEGHATDSGNDQAWTGEITNEVRIMSSCLMLSVTPLPRMVL